MWVEIIVFEMFLWPARFWIGYRSACCWAMTVQTLWRRSHYHGDHQLTRLLFQQAPSSATTDRRGLFQDHGEFLRNTNRLGGVTNSLSPPKDHGTIDRA